MKNVNIKAVGILFFFLLLMLILPVNAGNNTHIVTISGVVKDNKLKKKIEYASISVPGTNIGTITNTDGEFVLKFNDSLQIKTIEISHIGYTNYRYPVDGRDVEDAAVFLSANSNELQEVIVHTIDPLDLVKQAIENIAGNYNNKASLLTGFYRETIRKKRNYISISEAVIEVYKTPYEIQGIESDRVQVYKGRQLMSIKTNDTLAVKFQGGPTLSNYADIVKNPDVVLDLQTLHFYKFTIDDVVIINERPHYVVGFVPQVIVPHALYFGKLYIDRENLTFSRAEFSLSMDNRNKVVQAILRKKPYKLQFKPEEVAFLVTYKQRGGKSYLNYIRNEVRFKCDWKKKWIFSTGYTIVSEMVVTDSKENDISNIPRKQEFKNYQTLADQVGSFYDDDFWGDFNIIEPTESLESAVIRLRKQLQE